MSAQLKINVCVKGSHDWLFGDLRSRFESTRIDGVDVIGSEEPVTHADGWVFIRTAEASASPDLSRTVICVHDVYEHDDMYASGGHRWPVRHAAGLVLCHPYQRVIMERAGVMLDGRVILERPLGALECFQVRSRLPEQFTIGWIGRNHWRKRPHFFVEAIARFAVENPALRTVLAGKELDEIQSQIAALGVNCTWHSRTDTPISAYPEIYQSLDVLVITSCTEAGPLPLFEALATGLPVISTPVGWAPHFVALAPDFVWLARDADEIADCLRSVARRRESLFSVRHEIAALADRPRLDSWFGDILCLAASLVRRK